MGGGVPPLDHFFLQWFGVTRARGVPPLDHFFFCSGSVVTRASDRPVFLAVFEERFRGVLILRYESTM